MAETEGDPNLQAAVLVQCAQGAEGCIYWFNMFAWTLDPRELEGNKEIPFLLYPYQEDLIRDLVRMIEQTQGTLDRFNIIIKKSRDMGASWVIDLFFTWWWLFRNGSFTIGSRKEEEVDVIGDLDTHLAKIRWVLERLPDWMLPPGFDLSKHAKHLNIVNPEGGEITGESANANFARGGRKLAVLFDEHAAMGNDESSWTSAGLTTKVRISVSTPRGPFGKYYRLVAGEDGEECVIITWHWSIHPIYGAGLSTDADGKLTSPWYEAAKKALSPEDVAAELDISFATSIKGLVFGEYGDMHRAKNLIPIAGIPMLRVWDPGINGFAVLWLQVDKANRVLVYRELIMEHARLHDVATEVQRISDELEKEFGAFFWQDCGDPAGANRVASNQEQSEYETLFKLYEIDVDYLFMAHKPANMRVKDRITAIRNKMAFLVCLPGGKQSMALQVDTQHCPTLNAALGEKYFFKVNKLTKQVSTIVDECHPWEDVVDCLGYGIIYKCGGVVDDRKKRNYEIADDTVEWDGYRRAG